jgi:hypothetical protein
MSNLAERIRDGDWVDDGSFMVYRFREEDSSNPSSPEGDSVLANQGRATTTGGGDALPISGETLVNKDSLETVIEQQQDTAAESTVSKLTTTEGEAVAAEATGSGGSDCTTTADVVSNKDKNETASSLVKSELDFLSITSYSETSSCGDADADFQGRLEETQMTMSKIVSENRSLIRKLIYHKWTWM